MTVSRIISHDVQMHHLYKVYLKRGLMQFGGKNISMVVECYHAF